MDAIGLLPGIVDTSDSRESPSPTSIGNLYIVGGRSNSKNMTSVSRRVTTPSNSA